MTITRVNSSSISASGTTATPFGIALGVACAIGDLIIVTANCNGTHATNGMSVDETTNFQSFTTISETQQGGASSRWQQTFYLVTTVALSGTESIQLTPYALNTAATFVVDVFRGTAGTISRAVQKVSGVLGTTANNPALLSAPPAGDLVLTLTTVSSGTATQPSPFLLGSQRTTGPTTSTAYVLAADGTSTYGGTWTWGTSNTSALQTVAFAAAVVASGPRAAMQVSPPFAWPLVTPPFIGASQPLGNPAVGTGSALVVSRPRLPRRPLRAILTASFPLGNPAVPTPSPLVVNSPWSAKVPGALLFGPGAPAPVVSTASSPAPLVVTPPFAVVPVPPVILSASQPLGNPAVGSPAPLVVGTPWMPRRGTVLLFGPGMATASVQPLTVGPTFAWPYIPPVTITESLPLGNPATGTPQPLVVGPPFTAAPVPVADVSGAPAAAVVVTATTTPGPLVVGPPWQPAATTRAYLTWSQPLGRPAAGTPQPVVVGPIFRWPVWTASLISSTPVAPPLFTPAYVDVGGSAAGTGGGDGSATSSVIGNIAASGSQPDQSSAAGSGFDGGSAAGSLIG